MLHPRPSYLVFLNDFILLKLAYYLRTDPGVFRIRKPSDVVSHFDVCYNDETYVIKMSNPVRLAKTDSYLVWDFDVRTSHYTKEKRRRVTRLTNDCDYYILIGMQQSIPQNMYVIPAAKTPTNHVRIAVNGKSKYQQYLI